MMSNNPIRLTNKTAILLRKSAVKSLNIHYVCAVLLSVLMCVIAVLLGLKWLWAVPLVVGLTVIMDMLLVFHGRRVYLSLIGQAICTEAAAREIRAGVSEAQRREKAITDLIGVKADAQRATLDGIKKKQERKKAQPDAAPVYEEEQYARTAGQQAPVQIERQNNPAPRRRRREEGLTLIRGEQIR